MQRWPPKYGDTDVNTRTVHDLLTTINSMSARIKALERYERVVSEIHKVIAMMRPSFNAQALEPDAMPALIVQFFSESAERNLTHNINYKYDYNVGGALPFQPPPPQPFYPHPQYWPPQPPPQQPPQPPQPPPQPPQPPPQQPPQPPQQPPQPPYPEPAPMSTRIELTEEETRSFQVLQQNMQRQTINWRHLESFIFAMVQLLQARVVNSDTIVAVVRSLQNIDNLTNYDFNEFLNCVARETSVRLDLSEQLCPTVVALIKLFKTAYMSITSRAFMYVNSNALTASVVSVEAMIVQLVTFFTKIYLYVMKVQFVYTDDNHFVREIQELYVNVSSQMTSLQTQIRDERASLNGLTQNNSDLIRERDNVVQEKNNVQHMYDELDKKYNSAVADNRRLASEIAQLKPLAAQNKNLQIDNKNLSEENIKLINSLNNMQSQLDESPLYNSDYRILIDIEKQKTKKAETRLKQSITEGAEARETISNLQTKVAELETQLTVQAAEYQTALQQKRTEYEQAVASNGREYVSKLDTSTAEISSQYAKIEQLTAANVELTAQLAKSQTQAFQLQQQAMQLEKALIAEKEHSMGQGKPEDVPPSALREIYEKAKVLNPNLGPFDNWVSSLSGALSSADVLNIGAANAFATQISEALQPLNTVVPPAMRLLEAKPGSGINTAALLNSLQYVVGRYVEIMGENNNLIAEYSQQINALKLELDKNVKDVEQIDKLVQNQNAPGLNNQTIQSLQKDLETLQSRFDSLNAIKREQLGELASASAQVELSKLNEQINKINILLSSYSTITADIFKWKSEMLKVYESLARTSAEAELID
nr:Desmoplakin [Samia ricini nucleopolyhedrovirus]